LAHLRKHFPDPPAVEDLTEKERDEQRDPKTGNWHLAADAYRDPRGRRPPRQKTAEVIGEAVTA
jgi:hypothetical protein